MKKALTCLFVLLLTLGAFAPAVRSAATGPAPQSRTPTTRRLNLAGPPILFSGWQTTRSFSDRLFDVLPAAGTPPAENWANYGGGLLPLGGGVDDNVFDVVVDASGNLYAGGAFDEFAGNCQDFVNGGTDCQYIAKWNGSTWSALETGTNNQVYVLAVDSSGNVYAGGSFTSAGICTSGCNYIARWNGSNWSPLGGGVNGQVDALAVDGSGNVYAGGEFTSAGSCTSGCQHIAKWDGSIWSSVSGGITGNTVNALVFDGNVLYVGGNFYGAGSCSALNGCEYLAQWNGSAWSAVGGSAGYIIFDLVVDSGHNLYAGGIFTSMPGCATGCNRIAQWNGSTWSALGSGVPDSGSQVFGLASDGSGNLYVGGNFTRVGNCTTGCNGIARWDGSTWTPLGSGLYDYATGLPSAAGKLTYDKRGRLYVGGWFTRTSNKHARYISYWTAGEGQCGLAAGGDYTFYAGNLPVGLHINTLGTLDCLSMQRFNVNHPHAQSYQSAGYYWSLFGLDSSNDPATGFDVGLTLPYANADGGDSICRWLDSQWRCARTSYVANTSVTHDHVTHFSDWAVGNEAPAAVIVEHFKAAPDTLFPWAGIGLGAVGLAICAVLVQRWRRPTS